MQQLLKTISTQQLASISQQLINAQPEPFTIIHLSPINPSFYHEDALKVLRDGATLIRSRDSDIWMGRKGGPHFNEYEMNCFKDYYQNKLQKKKKSNSFALIDKIINLMKDGKSIEVIKSEYPYGGEIQIAYASQINRWVLSNESLSIVFRDQEELNSLYANLAQQQAKLCNFWIKESNKQQKNLQLKKLLSSYTLCGKILKNKSKIVWYCLVKHEQNGHICQDLFNANQIFKKYGLGLRLVKIKSMGVLNNEDQLHRTMNSMASSIYSQQCQSSDGSFGRSRVYFVETSSSKVIGGFDLLTFEDLVFNTMQYQILNKIEEKESLKILNQFFINFSKNYEVRTPYPLRYYSSLLKMVKHIIKQNKLEEASIKQNWFYLLKLSLYFSLKRLNVQKYSTIYYQNPLIKSKINDITFEQFGPIDCNIVILYHLINPSQYIKRHYANTFKHIFNDLQQHFDIIEQQFNTQQISQRIMNDRGLFDQTSNKVRHYYLNNNPKLQQINGLTKQLHRLDLTHSYYKIILLLQEEKHNYMINDNKYPFSIQTIVSAYRQTWANIKYKGKLSQRYQEYKKITAQVQSFKNYDFYLYKHTTIISTQFQDENNQIIESIQKVLQISDCEQEKTYYPLMARIQKQKKQFKLPNIKEQIQSIIKSSYFFIQTLQPQ